MLCWAERGREREGERVRSRQRRESEKEDMKKEMESVCERERMKIMWKSMCFIFFVLCPLPGECGPILPSNCRSRCGSQEQQNASLFLMCSL